MDKNSLDKDAIPQPELWRMALLVSDKTLDVALYPPVAREQMLWHRFNLGENNHGSLHGLEDVIYDNPLLLSDFRSVSCILNFPSLVIPKGIDTDQAREVFTHNIADSATADRVDIFDCNVDNAVIAMGVSQDVTAFLSRTYYNARFYCRLAEMVKYFSGIGGKNDGARVMITMYRDELTLVALEGEKLLMANNFTFQHETDAAYYILASLQCLGLDMHKVKVMIGASGSDTSSLHELLSHYISNVMPMPFPPLRFRATKDLMKAPIELLIRCE